MRETLSHKKKMANTSRRRVLQATGITGLAGFGVSVGAAKESTEAEAENVVFAELGVSFNYSANVTQDDQYDPVSFYRVTEDKLTFTAVKESDLKIFQDTDGVILQDGYYSLPVRLTRKKFTALTTNLNKRLRPAGGVLLSEPVHTPALRVENIDGEIMVSLGKNTTRVEPGTSETIDLGAVSSVTREGQSLEATAEATVSNHGYLDVFADTIVRGE